VREYVIYDAVVSGERANARRGAVKAQQVCVEVCAHTFIMKVAVDVQHADTKGSAVTALCKCVCVSLCTDTGKSSVKLVIGRKQPGTKRGTVKALHTHVHVQVRIHACMHGRSTCARVHALTCV